MSLGQINLPTDELDLSGVLSTRPVLRLAMIEHMFADRSDAVTGSTADGSANSQVR
jgi:hypothetical protein